MSRARLIALLFTAAACGSSSSPQLTSSSSVPGAAAATAQVPVPEGPGRVADGSFESKALGVAKRYKVYLPAGYETATARRYPVVYMLHGLGGDETNWIEAGGLDAAADKLHLQAIVVMPDGDDGFYANAVTPVDREACLGKQPPFSQGAQAAADYCVEAPRYEDYITQDLVAHVDATYRTIAEREARGIGGLSMGGFGALQLAMRHRDLFAATASHSGVDALLYVGPHPYQAGKVELLEDVRQWGVAMGPLGTHVRAIFGSAPKNWHGHDPASLVRELKDGALAIYLDCGSEDFFLLHDGAQYLHDLLTDRGIQHEWYLGPGSHTFDFWRDRIDDSLGFFARSLTPAR